MSRTRPSLIDRAFRPFATVHAGEGVIALLLFACVFSILGAYYVLKAVREGLILSGGLFGLRGEELKIYATGAMALMFLAVVPMYGALAKRVRRIRLVAVSYATVLACLGLFYVLGRAGLPIGLPFYLWLGLVSMLLVAQFWSYANDVYTEEQGKRLFAIIALGGSAGGIVGPKLAALADTLDLLIVAAALLATCLALFFAVERRLARRAPGSATRSTAPIGGEGGFTLVLRDRYLLAIAAMALVANLVNTTGEYVLSSVAANHAADVVSQTSHADLLGAAREAAITADRRDVIVAFYADLFFWVNAIGFLVQAFVVSRAIKWIGVRGALFVLPIIAFGTYGIIAAVGGVSLVRAAKIAENATDYSLQNTVRQTLFLPTSREVKFKAKVAIDTFFVRFGDAISAIVVAVGIHELGFGGRQLAVLNLGLIGVWCVIAAAVAHGHRALTNEHVTSSITGAGELV